jgi:hypothetical protein
LPLIRDAETGVGRPGGEERGVDMLIEKGQLEQLVTELMSDKVESYTLNDLYPIL